MGVTLFAGGNPSLGAGPGTALPVAYGYVPSVLSDAIVEGIATADQSALTMTAAEAAAAVAVEGLGDAVDGLGDAVDGLATTVDGLGSSTVGVQGLGEGISGCPTCIAVLDDGGDGSSGGDGAAE